MLLLGSGELGREVAVEAIRYGIHVVACDRYKDAPAMQVAQESRVFSMLDSNKLRQVIEEVKPAFIVPEIEAIATTLLEELEAKGYHVVPTARAARLTMDREGIRRLAAEELGLKTSAYRFAETEEEYRNAVSETGIPCVVKPVMSSSGKGQSVVRSEDQVLPAYRYAHEGARGTNPRLIVEEYIDFDYEITLLTVRHREGTSFCAPVGHYQIDGDYRESWQPHPVSEPVLDKAKQMAQSVTAALGGYGVFGVELFVKKDEVYFSEVSPRPHDTGMVTMISQNLSEFALHVRAILGLPVPEIIQTGPAASAVILPDASGDLIEYSNLDAAMNGVQGGADEIRLFGKPEIHGRRRLGVALAKDKTIEAARNRARTGAALVNVEARYR